MENSYQKFAKDILIIGVTNLLVTLSALILLSLLTKTIGAQGYGMWAQVDVTIQLAIGIVGLGLPFALSRFLAAETDKGKLQDGFYSAFTIVTLAALAASILLILVAKPVAAAFFAGATQIVRITGLIVLVWSLDLMLLGLFRARRQMRSYAIFMIATKFGEVGLIAYLVLNGHGILSVILCLLAVRTLIFLALFFFVKSQIGIKRPRFCTSREYLSFSLPTIPGLISDWVVASSDRYIIGYFLGVTSVGIYSASYNLGILPLVLAGVLGFVLPPTLSKLYDEGRMNEVKTLLSYSLKYLLMIAIPFVCGAAVLSKQVLRLFSTSEIASQGYYVVPVVALATLLVCICIPFDEILVLVKKTKIGGIACTLAALINLGLNLLIVPIWGILGAAITTLIAYSVLVAIEVHYSLKEFRFDIDWRFIIKSLIASAIMTLVIWSMHPQSNLNIIITALVGVAVYGAAIFLLRGFAKEEISFFRGLVQRGGPAANSDDKAK